jgi:hypothetical protein
MLRKHSLIKKIQESSPPTDSEQDSLPINKPSPNTTRDYWSFIFIIVFLVSESIGLSLSIKSLWLRSQLPQSGVHTIGSVIEHRYFKGHFYITSEYDAVNSFNETQSYIQEYSCTEEQYRDFPEGSQVPIIYLLQNPKTSDIVGNETNLFNDYESERFLMRFFISTGGAVLVIVILQSIRRHLSSRNQTLFRSSSGR